MLFDWFQIGKTASINIECMAHVIKNLYKVDHDLGTNLNAYVYKV